MREIISPFRNRNHQEEEENEEEQNGWIINPVRVKQKPKEHLGSYIFNDSPDNTYEDDDESVISPGKLKRHSCMP